VIEQPSLELEGIGKCKRDKKVILALGAKIEIKGRRIKTTRTE
jgi:hypothetical protein